MRPVYLDYAATTPVAAPVLAAMMDCLGTDGVFGNPGSASHEYGDCARSTVERARAQVAAAVGAEADEIVWTSGATEANNLALFGVTHYYAKRGKHMVTSRTEHKAVLDPCAELVRRGWRVTYLVPGAGGIVEPHQVAAALTPETVLVSIMHVNNEIGVVQDVAGIAQVCARQGAWLHVDAAQSMGKVAVDFARSGVDLMSFSAHKVYGPKGVGALCVSRRAGVQLAAQIFGVGQERGVRAGTLATHQVVGMGAAFELAQTLWIGELPRIKDLQQRLSQGLMALGGVLRNGDSQNSVPHLLNLSFEGVEGESLLAAVAPQIAVSTGSACMSANPEPSYVLRALGRDEQRAESSLRFSLGRFTTEAEIDVTVSVVKQAVLHLRRIGGAGILGA